VRLRQLQKQKLQDLAWYLLGFFVVQLGLAVGVDFFWPAIRDPTFDYLERIVRQRQAEPPGRPLVLALGSSRTKMGLRAEYLNNPSQEAGPVVLNCAVDGGGPMMYQVLLRRLLNAGIRTELVFLEIMPMSLSARRGSSFEERSLPTERFSAAEVARVCGYYAQSYRLLWPWGRARVVPSLRHQAELRAALALDIPTGGRPPCDLGRDAYGWYRYTHDDSPSQVEVHTKDNLGWYHTALTQPVVAPGVLQAFRDVVHLCLDEHIAVVFIAPPEGSAFRSYAPAVAQSQMESVRSLARELAVPLIDARNWVDDDGFWDGHHATERGATQYTERFARDALVPSLLRLRDHRQYDVGSLGGVVIDRVVGGDH